MADVTANPALTDLTALLGEWRAEVTMPGAEVTPIVGRATGEWLDGGAFLIIRSSLEWAGPSASTMVIGRDDASEDYSTLYFDARGVSRIYATSFRDGVWRQWRDSPGFSQRFVGTFSDDNQTINASWEKSENGTDWEYDFSMTFTRVSN